MTASSALRRQAIAASSCSFFFFSSRCWSAIAMATWVFTWSSWFSISRRSWRTVFSGFSALSIRSFTFARSRIETRSSNAMAILLWCCLVKSYLKLAGVSSNPSPQQARSGRGTQRRGLTLFVAVLARLHRFDVAHQIFQVHTGECLKERGHLGGDLGDFAGKLVGANIAVIAGRDDSDFVDLRQ